MALNHQCLFFLEIENLCPQMPLCPCKGPIYKWARAMRITEWKKFQRILHPFTPGGKHN